ncbi:MAG: hypothetical protein WC878_03035 [Candidatus Paceibacterota bacterium]
MLYLTKSQIIALGMFNDLIRGNLICETSEYVSFETATRIRNVFTNLYPRIVAVQIESGKIAKTPNKTMADINNLDVNISFLLKMRKKWQNGRIEMHLISSSVQDYDCNLVASWIVTKISLKAKLIGELERFYVDAWSGKEIIPQRYAPDLEIEYNIN